MEFRCFIFTFVFPYRNIFKMFVIPFGFTFCGIIPEVGMKFECYQNIRNYALLV